MSASILVLLFRRSPRRMAIKWAIEARAEADRRGDRLAVKRRAEAAMREEQYRRELAAERKRERKRRWSEQRQEREYRQWAAERKAWLSAPIPDYLS